MPALASEPVTIDNFRRAETDHYFKTYVDKGCFGKLCNDRAALVAYAPGKYTLTMENMGPRYVAVLFRTFTDPNDLRR